MMMALLGLIGGVILADVHLCLPALARWIVRWRAAKLPADLREYMEEPWLAEVEACPSHFVKMLFAVGLFWRTGDLLRAHREDQALVSAREKAGVTGNVTVTLTGVSATGSVGNVAAGAVHLTGAAPDVIIRVSDDITAKIVEAVGTAVGSSSAEGVPMTWQNSSVFEAATLAIRNSQAHRVAQTHAAARAMISSTAALFPPTVTQVKAG